MKKLYTTYVLYSDLFKRLYIGHTDNINKRLKRHNGGKVQSTRSFRPYRIIYNEEFDSRLEAIKRESELKTLDGRRFVRQFIAGTGRPD